MANPNGSGGWIIKRLIAEDFSVPCREDRFCVPCAAAFCDHCCGELHRGPGHEVVVRAAAAAEGDQLAQPGAAQGPARSGDRDSFCVTCGAGFSAALCGHHVEHDTFRVVVFEGLYCVRLTGSEPWFDFFSDVQSFRDEEGHILIPLHPRHGGPRCGPTCKSCGQ